MELTISWTDGARVGLRGLGSTDADGISERWCGSVSDYRDSDCWVEVPAFPEGGFVEDLNVIRVSAKTDERDGPITVTVGPHRVVFGIGNEPDCVQYSRGRRPSQMERDLLIDVAVNHLLSRQGLPVLHSCAFELGGVSVLGLGESFAGKTTVSVAVMRAGGRVVSDDVVLVVPRDGGYSLLPVRSWGWLRGKTREIVPGELREKMTENEENGEPRWVLDREAGGEGFVDRSTPDVIWIQSIDRRLKESRVEPVDQGQVFAALIRASSPLYLSRHCPEIRDKLIPVFQALCAQCRGFRVRLSPRLLEAPEQEMERLIDLSR